MGTNTLDATVELEGLQAWRPEVCEAFVDAHYAQVYRFFRWLTGENETAADLTQETFAAFWESVGRREASSIPDLRTWLYGIARNRWRKRMRNRPPVCEELEAGSDQPDPGPGPELTLLAALDADRTVRAVAELPPDLREALALRVFQELEYDRIAELLGIGVPLARWRVHQARLRLQRRLSDGEGPARETGKRARKEKVGAGSA